MMNDIDHSFFISFQVSDQDIAVAMVFRMNTDKPHLRNIATARLLAPGYVL